ncbi:pyridoxal-phosphate dependent enzyme [Bradyrhizobium sp. CCBAU 53421]|uniref:pyridoxal-phosphate dependent enzyme n=1 Tax=Bradyrhizobium sp. CCBAU 53421 TaxID=1325120 RepID=UPI00188DA743|nr:pyridoxal-phosphate dependent enzyme [Bradyrhizobium sp. CCBAU 53421]
MRKLEDFENPRFIKLRDGLYGASFFLMKLLPARFILERAAEEGLLRPGGRICASSSGNFGLALAMLAVQHGYQLTLVSDPTLDRHLHKRLSHLGVHLDIVPKPAASGGFQRARLDRLTAWQKETPDSYWPLQHANPHYPIAYAKFAAALIDRVGKIDCLVGTVGSGGSMCGTCEALRALFPELNAIGVDTLGSVLFGQPSGRRYFRGLGGDALSSNLDHRHFDEVHWLPAADVVHATHRLHREHGLFMGPTSGAAFKVAEWWSETNPGKTVVAVFPDEGHCHTDSTYNEEWLSSSLGWPISARQEPLAVAAPTDELKGWSWYKWGRRALDEVLSGLIDHAPRRTVHPLLGSAI